MRWFANFSAEPYRKCVWIRCALHYKQAKRRGVDRGERGEREREATKVNYYNSVF
jgi:hypothetical protein